MYFHMRSSYLQASKRDHAMQHAGGMLMGLLNLGLKDCFDSIYGASAGAINATYFLTGE